MLSLGGPYFYKRVPIFTENMGTGVHVFVGSPYFRDTGLGQLSFTVHCSKIEKPLRGHSQKKLTTVSVIVTLRGGGVEAVTL